MLRPKAWQTAWLPAALGLLTVGWASSAASRAWSIEPIKVEFLWQSSPQLDFDWQMPPYVPIVAVTADDVRADAVTQRMKAAQDLLRVPRSPLVDQAAVLQALIARLEAGEEHARVRLEMIAAACELDDGTHARTLWKLGQADPVAERVVEQACIKWHSNLPLEKWRASLTNSTSSEQDLLMAVDGLGQTGDESDVARLEVLVKDTTRTLPLRIRAAKALGQVAEGNRLALANQLRASKIPLADFMAVNVLARSPVEAVTSLVQEIALHSQPLAQRAAYEWLCRRDGPTAQRLADGFLKHSDSEVRALALGQMQQAANEQTLPALFAAFRDANPNVRNKARELILESCDDTRMQATTLNLLDQALQGDDWRELEQSIRLAVELKQPKHCERLLALLDHKRAEVCISAGWALRHLAVDEAILQRMLDHAQNMTNRLVAKSTEVPEEELRVTAHLFEAFGQRKYEPAKDLVLKYVPKNFNMGLITRMTAVWTCGRLWERAENKQLIAQLHERIADKASPFPELFSVRFAATLALGWIADPESRDPLITNDEPKPTPIGYATEWALKRIDNKE